MLFWNQEARPAHPGGPNKRQGVTKTMREYHGFTGCGSFYKGNLHSHTTISDGMLTPEQNVAQYKEHGYHFLCMSEHDIYTDHRAQFNTENFIVLPGVEATAVLYRAIGTNERYKLHHMHGILGTTEMQQNAPEGTFGHLQYLPPIKFFGQWEGAKAAQQLSDMLRAHGCVVTYNHPVWSRVLDEEFMDTTGVTALEIFNYNSTNEAAVGSGLVHWDRMLRAGKRINGFASDDNHNEGLFDDACGGWICVQAESLTHDAIVENFMKGNYYSSAGPEIYDWGVRDGKVWIDCSKVERVNFVAGNIVNDGGTVIGELRKDTLTHAEHTLKGHESYVRVEVVDRFGRAAWTNPIYLEWD